MHPALNGTQLSEVTYDSNPDQFKDMEFQPSSTSFWESSEKEKTGSSAIFCGYRFKKIIKGD